MSYQTGTASSFADLKGVIETFLTGAPGYSLSGSVLTKTGTDINVEFGSATDYLTLRLGKTSTGSTLNHQHPNVMPSVEPLVAMANTYYDTSISIVFPVTYYFQYFSTPQEMFRCVIEYNNGYTQNIGFGEIEKATAMFGGVYIDGSACPQRDSTFALPGLNVTSMTWERAIVDVTDSIYTFASPLPFGQSRQNSTIGETFQRSGSTILWAEFMSFDWFMTAWVSYGSAIYSGTNYARGTGTQYHLRTSEYSEPEALNALQTYNANNTLVPIRLFASNGNGNHARIGGINDIRWTNIKNLNFGDVLDDGVDKWKCYPAFKKDAATVNGTGSHSGQIGYAIRYDGP